MQQYTQTSEDAKKLQGFLNGKSEHTLSLFHHFVQQYRGLGNVVLYPTKSMIGVGNSDTRVAWITQLGKKFIHVVFPFKEPHEDNLCFNKIAQVPGDDKQFNHHLRLYQIEDVNEEVLSYMQLALLVI